MKKTILAVTIALVIVAASLVAYLVVQRPNAPAISQTPTAQPPGTSTSPQSTPAQPPVTSTTTTHPVSTTQSQTTQPTTTTQPSGQAGYVIVVDLLNRTVKVPTNVTRVVAIGPGALRLVAYLNATDLLVGVEQMDQQAPALGCDYRMAYLKLFQSLPTIGQGGPGKPPNVEAIIAVRPQVIVMSEAYKSFIDPDELSRVTGAAVIVVSGFIDLAGGAPDSFYKSVTILGKALGREQRAHQLIVYVKSLIEDLYNRTKDVKNRPSVYVGAVSAKGGQPFTSTWGRYPPLALLNTPSIADTLGKPGLVAVDMEYIIKTQPDYIFIDVINLDAVLQDFQKDPSKYCMIKAFKEGRVYGILPVNFYGTNVPIVFADAYFIGKVLYPDKFKDVDPAAKADEIYKMLLGRPLTQDFTEGYKQLYGADVAFQNISFLFKC
ncbi:MAG: iron ABC transporter substrate-binding protein [Pyrobaculum sp.]